MKSTYIAAGIFALSSSLSAGTIFFGGGGGNQRIDFRDRDRLRVEWRRSG